MGFKIVPRIKEYNFPDEERYVARDYPFNCEKADIVNNRYEIYAIDSTGEKKLHEGYCDLSEDGEQSAKEILAFCNQFIFPSLPDIGIISGAHMVVNLADKYSCGEIPLASAKLAMQMIETLQTRHGKTFDFLVQYNDLYIEPDNTRVNENDMNFYRKKMFEPLIIPVELNKLLNASSEKLQRDIPLRFCTSKNCANKFKRYIRKKKKNMDCFAQRETPTGSDWKLVLRDKEITVLHNDKPNCVSANAGMMRDIRYTIDNDNVQDAYFSYVGIFPICSKKNVLEGISAAYYLYPNFNLKTFIIFYGDSCK